MASETIILKFNEKFPKSFLYRKGVYFGIKPETLDNKTKEKLVEVTREKLKSFGSSGDYTAVYFFLKNSCVYLLPSRPLLKAEEKSLDLTKVRGYLTLAHNIKNKQDYNKYLLKSSGETSDPYAKKKR